MKTIIILAVILTTSSISFANQPVVPSKTNQSIQVEENKNHAVTVSWNDASFETIEIISNNNIFMPSIPTEGAKQIHLNNLEDGIYVINFRSGNQIVASKTVTIENNSILASN